MDYLWILAAATILILSLYSLRLRNENKERFRILYQCQKFKDLDIENKRFFIERRESHSSNVQLLFITLIFVVLSISLIKEIAIDLFTFLPLPAFVIVASFVLFGILWSWFYLVKTRIDHLEEALEILHKEHARKR